MKSFYAIKKDQLHTYDSQGKRLLVTRLLARPLKITQVKSQDKDKYQALQVAIGSKKRINKPLAGHVKKIEVKPLYLREIRLEKETDKKVADEIKITEVLAIGDIVTTTAKSKGKGFAGGMKRWGFAGGPRTHGQSDRPRSPGSIGQGTTPGRVWKGKKMSGRMGYKNVTTKGSQIVFIDEDSYEIWIKGAISGAKGELVKITKRNHKEFSGIYEGKLELKDEVQTESKKDKSEKKKEVEVKTDDKKPEGNKE